MLKKIAFYILNDETIKARNLLTCRLVNKAYEQKLLTYIFTSSTQETEDLNVQLWTFSDISFVPHQIYEDISNNTTITNDKIINQTDNLLQVLIGNTTPPSHYNQVLINLTNQTPFFIERFSHVIEVVINNSQEKNFARERYKYYQSLGYSIVTHNIDFTGTK